MAGPSGSARLDRRAVPGPQTAAPTADSGFAKAWAGLGDASSLRGGFGYLSVADAFARGRAAANRAVALDSTLADAHTALGFINLFYDWDWDAARGRLERALRLDPTYGEARLFYGWLLVATGRADEAVDSLRTAIRDEPVSLILNARLGSMLMLAGKYPEAERQLAHTEELAANYRPLGLDFCAWCGPDVRGVRRSRSGLPVAGSSLRGAGLGVVLLSQ